MMKFLKRLLCRHPRVWLLDIELDGTSVYECDDCGKLVRIPLIEAMSRKGTDDEK